MNALGKQIQETLRKVKEKEPLTEKDQAILLALFIITPIILWPEKNPTPEEEKQDTQT